MKCLHTVPIAAVQTLFFCVCSNIGLWKVCQIAASSKTRSWFFSVSTVSTLLSQMMQMQMQMKLSLFNCSIMLDNSAACLLVTCASFSVIWWRILDWASAKWHTAEDKNNTYCASIACNQYVFINSAKARVQRANNPLDYWRTSLWNAIERQKSVRKIWSALARWAPHPPEMPMLIWIQVERRRFKADRNQVTRFSESA